MLKKFRENITDSVKNTGNSAAYFLRQKELVFGACAAATLTSWIFPAVATALYAFSTPESDGAELMEHAYDGVNSWGAWVGASGTVLSAFTYAASKLVRVSDERNRKKEINRINTRNKNQERGGFIGLDTLNRNRPFRSPE